MVTLLNMIVITSISRFPVIPVPPRRALLTAILLLTTLAQANAGATEIYARSPSRTDVAAALILAKDGDTVKVPAGTATWTATLAITKNITLEGAGAASTVIVDEIVRTKPESPLINAITPALGSFRLTGFTFRGGTTNVKGTSGGEIRIVGNCHAIRVDYCTFDKLNGVSLATAGFTLGVIDHNTFNPYKGHPIIVNHDVWQPFNGAKPSSGGLYSKGNGSWADDPYWGTDRFIFIEDNIFVDTSGPAGTGIDMFEGARAVVRHNNFKNVGLTNHGTEGQGRGGKQIEEYENTYFTPATQPLGQLRAGTIIAFNNTYNNFGRGHELKVYRQLDYSPHWGVSNGQNPYDDNDPNGSTGYWESGSHTGPNGATTLTDSTKRWSSNQWSVPGVSYILRNVTKEAAVTSPSQILQAHIVSNSSTTINYGGSLPPLSSSIPVIIPNLESNSFSRSSWAR